MGSVLSSDSRAISAAVPRCSLDLGRAAQQQQRQVPSFDCAICLEVLDQPVRTQCGHIPICRLIPGGEASHFSRNFIKHLQFRHTFYYEDYTDINIVEEALIEKVLDLSFLE